MPPQVKIKPGRQPGAPSAHPPEGESPRPAGTARTRLVAPQPRRRAPASIPEPSIETAEQERKPEAAPAPVAPSDALTRAKAEELVDLELLGRLVQRLSAMLSDLDGAGPDGVLLETEAAQIARLIRGPMIERVTARIHSESQFRLLLAVVFFGIARGHVHARAIGARLDARRRPPVVVGQSIAERIAEREAAAAPPEPASEPAEPVSAAGFLRPEFAARQARAS